MLLFSLGTTGAALFKVEILLLELDTWLSWLWLQNEGPEPYVSGMVDLGFAGTAVWDGTGDTATF